MCTRTPQSACPSSAILARRSPAAASGIQGRGHEAGSRPRSQQQSPWLCWPWGWGAGWPAAPSLLPRDAPRPQVDCYPTVNDTIYSYGALTLDGDEYIPFERYKGKTVLFVNVATY